MIFKKGSKEKNDSHIGKMGTFTIDVDTPSIRFHDGVRPGGYIISMTPAVETPTKVYDYKNFIKTKDLCLGLGILSTSVNPNDDIEWLPFHLGEDFILVPKEPIIFSISYSELFRGGLTHKEQNSKLVINDELFSISLMDGADGEITVLEPSIDPPEANGSIYNAIFTHPIWQTFTKDDVKPEYPRWVSNSLAFDPKMKVVRSLGNNLLNYSYLHEDAKAAFQPILTKIKK